MEHVVGVTSTLICFSMGIPVPASSMANSGTIRGEARIKLFNMTSVGRHWFKLLESDIIILEKSLLMTMNSAQVVQRSLRHVYTETLYKVHMASSTKTGPVDLETTLQIRN